MTALEAYWWMARYPSGRQTRVTMLEDYAHMALRPQEYPHGHADTETMQALPAWLTPGKVRL